MAAMSDQPTSGGWAPLHKLLPDELRAGFQLLGVDDRGRSVFRHELTGRRLVLDADGSAWDSLGRMPALEAVMAAMDAELLTDPAGPGWGWEWEEAALETA
jgi:hypothetical protein